MAMKGGEEDLQYDVSTLPRGCCVIFNNTNFDNPRYATRQGSENDVNALERVFTSLKFEVSIHNDTSEVEMMLQLRQLDFPLSALFVIVMSHGENGTILTSDCKAVPVYSIASEFTVKNCPSLAQKPKVFIIQSCQGDEISDPIPICNHHQQYLVKPVVTERDGGETKWITPGTTVNEADFLFAFATISGKAALRDINEGSWYIQALAKALELYADHMSFIGILTVVANNLASTNCENKAQLCTYHSTLLKELFLVPRVQIEKRHRHASVPFCELPRPKQRHLSESYQERYFVSGGTSSGSRNLSQIFQNISRQHDSPCLVKRNSDSPLQVVQHIHQTSLQVSTAMQTIQPKLSEECSSRHPSQSSRSTPSTIESDHSLELLQNGCEVHSSSNESVPENTITYKMADASCLHGYLVVVDNIGSDESKEIIEKTTLLLRSCCHMHTQTYVSLSHKAMEHLFLSLSRTDHSKLNCLFIIVLSRGRQVKGVYDVNRKLLPLESICSLFSDANSPSLQGKPKIFHFETVMDDSERILVSNPLHYPNIENCFIILSTVMATANVSCILKFTEILCSQTGRNFCEVVNDLKLMHGHGNVGQIIIETNTFPLKSLLLCVKSLDEISCDKEDEILLVQDLKLAFNLWSHMRTLTIDTIISNIHKVMQVCNHARQVRVASSATSVVGGIVAILGLVLIPVTVGGSVVVSAVGGTVALAGGAGSFGSTLIDRHLSHSKLKKTQQCIDVDQQLCVMIKTLHQQLSQLLNYVGHDDQAGNKDAAKSLFHAGKLIQSGVYIAKGSVAATEMGRTGGALAVQGSIFAARLGTTALRAVAVAGAAVSIIILPWDIYELTTNAIKYHNRSENEVSKYLNEQLVMLRAQKDNVEKELHNHFSETALETQHTVQMFPV